MSEKVLQAVADLVLSRAQEHGFVVRRDIRADLSEAGLADSRWKEVLALVRTRLRYRNGRYYYVTPIAVHMRDRAGREHRHQLEMHQAVRDLIRRHRPETVPNRRRHRRITLGCPVDAVSADRREIPLLCTDISLGGLRLIGSSNLLDQLLCVRFSSDEDCRGEAFHVRILWSLPVGDDIFQNGGVFVDLATEADLLKIVRGD